MITGKAANAPKSRNLLRGIEFAVLAANLMTFSAASETGRLARRLLIAPYSNPMSPVRDANPLGKSKFFQSKLQHYAIEPVDKQAAAERERHTLPPNKFGVTYPLECRGLGAKED